MFALGNSFFYIYIVRRDGGVIPFIVFGTNKRNLFTGGNAVQIKPEGIVNEMFPFVRRGATAVHAAGIGRLSGIML